MDLNCYSTNFIKARETREGNREMAKSFTWKDNQRSKNMTVPPLWKIKNQKEQRNMI